MPRMCMSSGFRKYRHRYEPQRHKDIKAHTKLRFRRCAVGGVAVLVRVVIVVVVAFAAEVDVVKHDAEDSGADGRKFVAGALDRLAGIPAAVDDKDHAVDHGGEDHGVGDTAQWR